MTVARHATARPGGADYLMSVDLYAHPVSVVEVVMAEARQRDFDCPTLCARRPDVVQLAVRSVDVLRIAVRDPKRALIVGRDPKHVLIAGRDPTNALIAGRDPTNALSADRDPTNALIADRDPKRVLIADRDPKNALTADRDPKSRQIADREVHDHSDDGVALLAHPREGSDLDRNHVGRSAMAPDVVQRRGRGDPNRGGVVPICGPNGDPNGVLPRHANRENTAVVDGSTEPGRVIRTRAHTQRLHTPMGRCTRCLRTSDRLRKPSTDHRKRSSSSPRAARSKPGGRVLRLARGNRLS
jgi:hypothetical protein